ncbi:MAG TPA: DUF2854 domain-containing protein [Kamptonema sp.]|nr:DUF2854 domain-containing protein [Kamptonema sp.]
MLRQISLARIGLVVGSILTIVGFWAYFTGKPTLNLAGFFYGVPLLLGGLALKASELTPIPFTQPTPPEVETLRQQQATPTQIQLRKDVTRYRYGQEAHLDDTLSRFGLSPTDEERPVLQGLREIVIDDAYTLVLEFYSPLISLETWQEKQDKIATFFGPGLRAQVSQPAENRIDLALIVA